MILSCDRNIWYTLSFCTTTIAQRREDSLAECIDQSVSNLPLPGDTGPQLSPSSSWLNDTPAAVAACIYASDCAPRVVDDVIHISLCNSSNKAMHVSGNSIEDAIEWNIIALSSTHCMSVITKRSKNLRVPFS
jgi:hypothetical protein